MTSVTFFILKIFLINCYVEQGESPFIIALRELIEETGYIPTIIKKIGTF